MKAETLNALETMSKIAVPRKISHLNPDDHLEQIELHDFGDASFTKLWDSIYIRSICKKGEISVKSSDKSYFKHYNYF